MEDSEWQCIKDQLLAKKINQVTVAQVTGLSQSVVSSYIGGPDCRNRPAAGVLTKFIRGLSNFGIEFPDGLEERMLAAEQTAPKPFDTEKSWGDLFEDYFTRLGRIYKKAPERTKAEMLADIGDVVAEYGRQKE
ncbi:helix-turn-helix transcriptional regulator [Candidatus Woesearchaeota archaeon]|nr:helix-turn-helix transcriptional regulator [Candidatus Woesearchaeota archaeon]